MPQTASASESTLVKVDAGELFLLDGEGTVPVPSLCVQRSQVLQDIFSCADATEDSYLPVSAVTARAWVHYITMASTSVRGQLQDIGRCSTPSQNSAEEACISEVLPLYLMY
eukprot:jgi/Ulvmu1/12421/UM009_0071.1